MTPAKDKDTKKRTMRVAVIGCGPGGMFVCHALEQERRKLLAALAEAVEQEDATTTTTTTATAAAAGIRSASAAAGLLQDKLDALPSIVCFEQAGAPGGVWRSTGGSGGSNNNTSATAATTTTTHTKTDANMYEALWCNGPKEVCEFSDYTFDEHFSVDVDHKATTSTTVKLPVKLPVYLPRHAVLDYLVQRVTRHCPDFFETYAKFHTRVENVHYDAETELFSVQTTCCLQTDAAAAAAAAAANSNTNNTQLFDKVIWSGGQNGAGRIPGPIKHPFEAALAKWNQEEQDPSSTGSRTRTIPSKSTSPTPPPPPPFLHASAVEQSLAEHIKGRHLLLIGGSYSAEDLAFTGLKWGATHVTVLTRRHGIDVPVCWSNNWPDNKVSVVAGYVPDKVEIVRSDRATRVSYTITLKKYAYEINIQQVDETTTTTGTTTTTTTTTKANGQESAPMKPPSPKSVIVDETNDTGNGNGEQVITGVDVVICCTGYTENLDMLDKSCYNMTSEEYKMYWNGGDKFVLPENWTMPENPLSSVLGQYWDPKKHNLDCDSDSDDGSDDDQNDADEKKDPSVDATAKATKTSTDTGTDTTTDNTTTNFQIPPHRDTLYPGVYVNPYSFRELLYVHNPNLMWLAANNFDTPLLALDVQACLALRYITGEQPIPSREQMKAQNYEQALREMSMPMVRHWMDSNYYNVVQAWLSATTRKISYMDERGNPCTRYEYPPEWIESYQETSRYELHLLGRLMQDADYPLQVGTFDKLNETGELFMKINWNARNYATCPEKGTTFRDVTQEQCDKLQSIFTGTKPVPMKGRWLDMDDRMESTSDLVV